MKQYESVAQLAKRLGINTSTCWRWIKSGKLPQPTKFSPGCTRFDVEAVDAALAAQHHAPRTEHNTRAAHVAAERRRKRTEHAANATPGAPTEAA